MSATVTPELLGSIMPDSAGSDRRLYAPLIDAACRRYGIAANHHRLCAFLAQTGHESGSLRHVQENLNYSAQGLRRTFPKYFANDATASAYARQPERIANRVYANRLGNGDESSGDGWRYRGRGLIQITGRGNYTEASARMTGLPPGVTFVGTPELLATPRWAAESAAWWWHEAGLNELADKLGGMDEAEIFRKITKRINGGYNGLAERERLYALAKRHLP